MDYLVRFLLYLISTAVASIIITEFIGTIPAQIVAAIVVGVIIGLILMDHD
jgi:uncharacterized membrane protein YvlD (DUF360 family)